MMEDILKSSNGVQYIDLTGSDFSIQREGELNDLLGMCYTHNCNILLLDVDNLSDDFFNLRTGLAGAAMQKFANYQVKVAVLLPVNAHHNERFKELMYEMNQSNQIRFYSDRDEAENWLVKQV